LRFSKAAVSGILVLLGFCFAGGNLWFTSARSLIPLELNHVVERKELRREKIPGVDDVYMLHLSGGRVLQVDPAVYRLIQDGDAIQKESGSDRLQAGSRTITLDWSEDRRGMITVMPLAGLLLIGLGVAAFAPLRYHRRP
jgi:hypothetical protein